MEILWGTVVPPLQYLRTGWGSPPAILLLLCGREPEGHSLLAGQSLDWGHWGAGLGIKTPSTIQAPCHSPLSMHRPTGHHWLCSFDPLLGPLGREVTWLGRRGRGETAGAAICSVRCTSSWASSCSGTLGSSTLPRESGFLLWCRVPCSSPVWFLGGKPQLFHHHWGPSGEPCIL